MNINDFIEDPEKENTSNIPNGVFSSHPEKLLCYLDIQGITEYYNELNKKEFIDVKKDVKEKLFDGFIYVFSNIDRDIYSIHILSDSAIIVPKSRPKNSKKIPTCHEFIGMVLHYYENLLLKGNPSKFMISRGIYFSIYGNDMELNILPGGKVISDCANADKLYLKGKGPGIFSNLSELNKSSNSNWDLIDYVKFNCKFQNKDELLQSIDKIKAKLLNNQSYDTTDAFENLKKWVSL